MNPDLRAYIEAEIIPRYACFDAGHREDHARTVISNALELAGHYDVDADMVYAAAAYHDTGLAQGRDGHELASGRIIREDARLRSFFSTGQIETIAQAAEDHRASSKREPRSIYGRIVAEADRIIDADTIVRRAILYGLKNYPQLDKEGQYRRFCDHMQEKYAEGGYLRLWIPESPNAQKLKEFQALLKNPDAVREAFGRQWAAIEQQKGQS
ncbi:MAG: HD domain-containing protein [Bacteroidales bacterium]|nr:HD domain-containing protein [Bacteroidales bacterium]